MVAKVCILYTFGAYYFPDLGKYRLVSVLVYNGFSYRLFAPPGAFVLPKNFPPPIVNLTPLIAILAPPEAICTPNFLRVDRTLNCARYSRFFGIKTVNSGKMRPPEAAPVRYANSADLGATPLLVYLTGRGVTLKTEALQNILAGNEHFYDAFLHG